MRCKNILVSGLAVLLLGGCVTTQEPPKPTNFSYVPKQVESATKTEMNIAVAAPEYRGKLFDELLEADPTAYSILRGDKEYDHSATDPVVRAFLKAFSDDMQNVVMSKGFTVSGVYKTIGEMTFPEKERASLLLVPSLDIQKIDRGDFISGAYTSTISGVMSFTFYEPMSKEKVWVKTVGVPTVTVPVKMEFLRTKSGEIAKNSNGLLVEINRNSAVDLLNALYPQMFDKVGEVLDAREIQRLKTDSDKLKARTRYAG